MDTWLVLLVKCQSSYNGFFLYYDGFWTHAFVQGISYYLSILLATVASLYSMLIIIFPFDVLFIYALVSDLVWIWLQFYHKHECFIFHGWLLQFLVIVQFCLVEIDKILCPAYSGRVQYRGFLRGLRLKACPLSEKVSY